MLVFCPIRCLVWLNVTNSSKHSYDTQMEKLACKYQIRITRFINDQIPHTYKFNGKLTKIQVNINIHICTYFCTNNSLKSSQKADHCFTKL